MPQLNERADVLARKSFPRAGLKLLGRYELISFLARGGMGVVWKARHLQLGSMVAIKFAAATDAETRRRFLTEARSAAVIQSPHVVRVYDVGECDGVPFLVMELLEGETLAEHLRTLGRLDASSALFLLRQIASALECAHALGVVHGDLKPSNIFLTGDRGKRIAKILDFGVARNLRGAPREKLSAGGTLRYASPEQISANAPLDRSVDVWALGVVAFECVLGVSPYGRRSSHEVFTQVGKWSFDSTRCHVEAGAAFEPWFRTATALEPSSRFVSAETAIHELTRALGFAEQEPEERRAFATMVQDTQVTAPTLSADFEGGEFGERLKSRKRVPARANVAIQWGVVLGGVAAAVLVLVLYLSLRESSSSEPSWSEPQSMSLRVPTAEKVEVPSKSAESSVPAAPNLNGPRVKVAGPPASEEIRVENDRARVKKPLPPKPRRSEIISSAEGEGNVWEHRD